MKKLVILALSVTLVLVAYASAQVQISAINFDAPGNDHQNLNGEWVKITNGDTTPVSMTGWTISDEGNKHTYRFPTFSLDAGATITVYTGSGRNTGNELYMGYGQAIWNNNGDTATLIDGNGGVIDQMSNR